MGEELAMDNVEAFSVSRAAVLDNSRSQACGTGHEAHCFSAVRSAAVDLDFEAGEGTVELRQAFLSFALLAALWGTRSPSLALSDGVGRALPLRVVPARMTWPLALRQPARYGDGRTEPLTVTWVLYRVRFAGLRGALAYKDGLEATVRGRALLSLCDELGNALPEPAYGRIVREPGTAEGAFTPLPFPAC